MSGFADGVGRAPAAICGVYSVALALQRVLPMRAVVLAVVLSTLGLAGCEPDAMSFSLRARHRPGATVICTRGEPSTLHAAR